MQKLSLLDSMSIVNLHRDLDDILSWSRYPDPDPLSEDWLLAQRDRIYESTGAAIDAARRVGSNSLETKIVNARTLALRFVTMIQSDPKISTIPARHWTFSDDQILFEQLLSVTNELRQVANDAEMDDNEVQDAERDLIFVEATRSKAVQQDTSHGEGQRLLPETTSDDSPLPPVSEDVLKKVRAAIAEKGKNAKRETIVSVSESRRTDALAALRYLETTGEYTGGRPKNKGT